MEYHAGLSEIEVGIHISPPVGYRDDGFTMLIECCGKQLQVWKQFGSVAFVDSSCGQVFDWIDKLQNRVPLLESLSVIRANTFAESVCCQSVSYLKDRRCC